MIYNPICRNKILDCEFPKFHLHNYALLFVNSSRYLGHIIDTSASDNDDIHREIRNLFIIRMYLFVDFTIVLNLSKCC